MVLPYFIKAHLSVSAFDEAILKKYFGGIKPPSKLTLKTNWYHSCGCCDDSRSWEQLKKRVTDKYLEKKVWLWSLITFHYRKSSVIWEKVESQNGGNKNTKHATHQGVKNVRFSENVACFVFLLPPFWDSTFSHITDEMYVTITILEWLVIYMAFMFDRNSGGKTWQIKWLFESNVRSFGYIECSTVLSLLLDPSCKGNSLTRVSWVLQAQTVIWSPK